MKHAILTAFPFILSIVLCIIFMDTANEEKNIPVISEVLIAKTFKTGVFDNLEEAEKEANLKKGIVISNNEKYEVIIGILKRSSNLERMIDYLDEKNTYYYIEDIHITDSFNDILNKYEELMNSSTSSVAFLQLNKKILERYKILYES